MREALFLALAILVFAYFAVCLFYTRYMVSWLWLWPLLGVFFLARYFMLRTGVAVPAWVKWIYYPLVVCFLAVFAVVESRIISAMNTVPEQNLDYVIVLGAAVKGDEPTSPLLLRIEATEQYMKDNPGTVAIASGGQGDGEDISEAECIKRCLVEAGIDESRILLDDKSTDTEENIRNSFAFIPEGSRTGVVSSSFHIYRAVKIAALEGYTVSGIPARALYPYKIHYTVREFFAMVELRLKSTF